MSLAEENHLWILKHQILPNQYGLKRIALLKAIKVIEAAEPLAASSSPAPDTAPPFSDVRWHLGYEVGYRDGESSHRADVQAAEEDSPTASSPAWEPIRALIKEWRRSCEVTRAELLTIRKNYPEGPRYSIAAVETCADELEALLPPPPKEPT